MDTNTNFIIKHHKWVLLLIPGTILLASLAINPATDPMYYRGLRALFSVLLLGSLILMDSGENKLLKWHFLFYGLSSFLTIWFEIKWIGIISMLINIMALLFLIKLVWSKLKFKKMGTIFIMGLVIVALINAYLLFRFVEILWQSADSKYVILSIAGLSMVFFTLTVLAFVYNNEVNNARSITLIFAAIFLIFAEIFRGTGHYDVIDPILSQYIARGLLVIGGSLVYHFGYIELKDPIL